MRQSKSFLGCWPVLAAYAAALAVSTSSLPAQEPPQPAASQAAKSTEAKQADVPAASQTAKAAEEKAPELPAQIELLETRVRFEVNGDSRKEVHTRVRINNELGVRQFARLNFDYNRSFQQVELPLMRITHASGGTADILPSAISDQPNPAVVNFPAYQDVRVKSVRILGLEPGDLLEYRVVTTTTHHPLAPDFWLDHTFDRSGVVSHEMFELDVPRCRFEDVTQETVQGTFPKTTDDPLGIVPPGPPRIDLDKRPRFGQIRISPIKETSSQKVGDGFAARLVYKWELALKRSSPEAQQASPSADVMVTTFRTWGLLAHRINTLLFPYSRSSDKQIGYRLMRSSPSKPQGQGVDDLYLFVARKIKTVDLPLGSTGFRARSPQEILSSGYGTAEDKAVLLLALLPEYLPPCDFLLGTSLDSPEDQPPDPSIISQLLVRVQLAHNMVYVDPAIEVAPFGMLPSHLRGRPALLLQSPGFGWMYDGDNPKPWVELPKELPFQAAQQVNIEANIDIDGTLSAKVHYKMRGDNELLLRVAFHQAPKEKWKEVAQLLALSDGFRGKVTNVTASDPYATKEPFTVEYEITQPKFVDWGKKQVRVPALLPLMALPDPPVKTGVGAATSAIELGTPLDVQTRVTLHVPPDTGVSAPVGTSVARDYATFSSEYSAHDLTLTAERHIKFLLRQVPAERAADYATFVRSVQSDQAQEFTLDRAGAPAARPAAQRKDAGAKR